MNLFSPNPYEIAFASDAGKTRQDSGNQDAVRIVEPSLFSRRPPLMVIADGMGGHAGGELASYCVVDAFANSYKKKHPSLAPKELLEVAIRHAHDKIRLKGRKNDRLSDMGSTVVAAILEEKALHMVNVGDSRLYLFHEQNLVQISYDQSLVADKVRQGEITADEARNHPERNRLTMSISAHRKEVVNYYAKQSLEFNDVVLLCSDGLWGVVPETYIRATACQLPPQRAVKKLINLANSMGSPDNISVIIARRVGSSLEQDDEAE